METKEYFQRLVEMNQLAENIFCDNTKLLLLDNCLNGIRETKAGFRNNVITRNLSSTYTFTNTFVTLDKDEINNHLDKVESSCEEKRDEIRKRRKGTIKELINMNPSATEMSLEEINFLLR